MRLATDELLPLHNLEAEMSTLGAMILKEQAAEAVFGILTDDDFFYPAHREIFKANSDNPEICSIYLLGVPGMITRRQFD